MINENNEDISLNKSLSISLISVNKSVSEDVKYFTVCKIYY